METSRANRQTASMDASWMMWTLGGIVGIWVGVLLISLLSPDMVSGSEQEHLKIAAFTAWLWGLIATAGFVRSMGKLRGNPVRMPIWVGYAASTLVIWVIATVLSITLPVMETGSDPTRMPFGAMFTPLAAAVLTVVGGIIAVVFARPPALEGDSGSGY